MKVQKFLFKEKIYNFLFKLGFHFEAEEYSELIIGNDSLTDYIRSFTEIWYSNYSLTMCMDDLMAGRERAHDPFKLGRFSDELEAFRLYTGKSSKNKKIISFLFILNRSRSNDICINS